MPSVLNLKPQKCAVLRGRVASCPDCTGDPSPPPAHPAKSPAPSRIPLLPAFQLLKSRSLQTPFFLSFLLGRSFWVPPSQSLSCYELPRVWWRAPAGTCTAVGPQTSVLVSQPLLRDVGRKTAKTGLIPTSHTCTFPFPCWLRLNSTRKNRQQGELVIDAVRRSCQPPGFWERNLTTLGKDLSPRSKIGFLTSEHGLGCLNRLFQAIEKGLVWYGE